MCLWRWFLLKLYNLYTSRFLNFRVGPKRHQPKRFHGCRLLTGGPWMQTFKAAKRLMWTCWSDVLDVVISYVFLCLFLDFVIFSWGVMFWIKQRMHTVEAKNHVRLLVRFPTQNLLSLWSGLSFIMKLVRKRERRKKSFVFLCGMVNHISTCFLGPRLFDMVKASDVKDTESLEESVRHQSVPLADMISECLSIVVSYLWDISGI